MSVNFLSSSDKKIVQELHANKKARNSEESQKIFFRKS